MLNGLIGGSIILVLLLLLTGIIAVVGFMVLCFVAAIGKILQQAHSN